MTNPAASDHHYISVASAVEAETPLILDQNRLSSTTTTTKTLDELRGLRLYLKWSLLDHSTNSRRLASAAVFLLLGVVVPAAAAVALRGPSGSDPNHLNKLAHIPSSALAIAAFLSLLLRRPLPILLPDDSSAAELRRRHGAELDRALRRLALILLPAFLAELIHKAILFSSGAMISLPSGATFPANSGVAAVVLVSWVYRSGVFLTVCVMFRLTCEVQMVRMEGLQRILDDQSSSSVDCGVIFSEHVKIRKQLWVTSHSYRFFIVGSLFIITVSQFGALLLLLGSKTKKNFLNSGDLVVCSAVEISGFFLCLVGAARITHRAQRIVSFATRWHMRVTCESNGLNHSKAHFENQPNYNNDVDFYNDSCDSSSDTSFISVSPQQHTCSFQTRQALVSYLEHNNGGITLFGFVLDRGLLHTLFVFEFSLVLWILSKVVVLS